MACVSEERNTYVNKEAKISPWRSRDQVTGSIESESSKGLNIRDADKETLIHVRRRHVIISWRNSSTTEWDLLGT